jgi:hypothetical protein
MGKLDILELQQTLRHYVVPTNTTTTDNAVAVDNSGMTKWSKAGYFEYQF